MKQSGFYSYVKQNTDIKTKYIIEYTQDKKVFDIMGSSKFNFDMLKKLEFDFLQDAINTYNRLYYNESVLHVMLFEQIIFDGEIILEQCKDMIAENILPQVIKQRIEAYQMENEAYKAENEKLKKFLAKYNIDMSRVNQELTE